MTEAEKQKLYAHPAWESCTFEGAELSTLRLGLETTFREKLEWLEAAEDLFLQLRTGRTIYPDPAAGGAALKDAPPTKPQGE
jgi:hypothetical protein